MNIPELHEAYCHWTGLHLRYMPLEHDSDWFLWSKAFDEHDLKLVIEWLQSTQKDKCILANQLAFRHLIRCRDYFGEYLAQAQAEARKPKPTPKDDVLKATGRPACNCGKPAQSAATILQRKKLAEMLAQWRKENLEQPGSSVSSLPNPHLPETPDPAVPSRPQKP